MKKIFTKEKIPHCPACKTQITKRETFFGNDIPEELDFKSTTGSDYVLDINAPLIKSNSKIMKLIEIVEAIKQKSEKVVIFTQFISMMNLIEKFLSEKDIPLVRLEGSVQPIQRSNRIEIFNQKKDITVLLMSLKTGCVGLNLNSANHIILVDPWWNPAIEEQAIDRVHRMGQTKDVEVKRLICKETIEERESCKFTKRSE